MLNRECYRVLKRGGIIRVVAPDLETIARAYLQWLDRSLDGDAIAERNYDWILLELFDQMVRNVSGGEMLRYWYQNPMPAEDYVIERMGAEVKDTIEHIRASGMNYPGELVDASFKTEQIGCFRLSGEVHQWMYDRYSLSRLLRGAGFKRISICRAEESSIANFYEYSLDLDPGGLIRKPDSLFVEASKPE